MTLFHILTKQLSKMLLVYNGQLVKAVTCGTSAGTSVSKVYWAVSDFWINRYLIFLWRFSQSVTRKLFWLAINSSVWGKTSCFSLCFNIGLKCFSLSSLFLSGGQICQVTHFIRPAAKPTHGSARVRWILGSGWPSRAHSVTALKSIHQKQHKRESCYQIRQWLSWGQFLSCVELWVALCWPLFCDV